MGKRMEKISRQLEIVADNMGENQEKYDDMNYGLKYLKESAVGEKWDGSALLERFVTTDYSDSDDDDNNTPGPSDLLTLLPDPPTTQPCSSCSKKKKKTVE
jgi:hypothetical protein